MLSERGSIECLTSLNSKVKQQHPAEGDEWSIGIPTFEQFEALCTKDWTFERESAFIDLLNFIAEKESTSWLTMAPSEFKVDATAAQ